MSSSKPSVVGKLGVFAVACAALGVAAVAFAGSPGYDKVQKGQTYTWSDGSSEQVVDLRGDDIVLRRTDGTAGVDSRTRTHEVTLPREIVRRLKLTCDIRLWGTPEQGYTREYFEKTLGDPFQEGELRGAPARTEDVTVSGHVFHARVYTFERLMRTTEGCVSDSETRWVVDEFPFVVKVTHNGSTVALTEIK